MQNKLNEIAIDYSRDSLFDELGIKRLKESYMREDETSPQERFAYVSKAFGSNPAHAQRLYEYSSKHWLSYSTPFFLLVVVVVASLFHVFFRIYMTAQKVLSTVLLKSIGYRC